MKNKNYYTNNGISTDGPFTYEQLLKLSLEKHHLIWEEGWPQWMTVEEFIRNYEQKYSKEIRQENQLATVQRANKPPSTFRSLMGLLGILLFIGGLVCLFIIKEKQACMISAGVGMVLMHWGTKQT